MNRLLQQDLCTSNSKKVELNETGWAVRHQIIVASTELSGELPAGAMNRVP